MREPKRRKEHLKFQEKYEYEGKTYHFCDASYKAEFVDNIPKSGSGKILRRELIDIDFKLFKIFS